MNLGGNTLQDVPVYWGTSFLSVKGKGRKMIELQNVSKIFTTKEKEIDAVNDVSLQIEKGDIYGIIGLSGAGKSTLVRCINYLEKPSSGNVLFNGVDLASLSAAELRQTRRQMSMIFQDFNLLAQRTVIRNVCYPLEIAGWPKAQQLEKAHSLLKIVALDDRCGAYPVQLSGGMQQRVAIARALATDPQVLLCDEATSALDPETTRSILALLKKINRELGVTIVVITHEMKVVEQICNKVAVLDNGRIVESGLVADIFRAPKSAIARKLIMPDSAPAPLPAQTAALRIVFDGRSSYEPLISKMITECHITVNILAANMKNLNGKAYGQMVLQIPDDPKSEAEVKKFLTGNDVHFEEVGSDESVD